MGLSDLDLEALKDLVHKRVREFRKENKRYLDILSLISLEIYEIQLSNIGKVIYLLFKRTNRKKSRRDYADNKSFGYHGLQLLWKRKTCSF